MEKMIDLTDLLKHQIMDLYSAEEQIIEALPAMIDKAANNDLKKALQQHLKVTEEQKKRLDKVQQLLTNKGEEENTGDEKKGFFSRLFSGSDEKCKGMSGLIDEGQKIMKEDISPKALDAAIIGSAQKIEHYEISGYGTARAYARELKLQEVEKLLEQTLNEEYEADDRLTQLAVGRLNIEAEKADTADEGETNPTASRASSAKNETRQGGKETSEKKNAGKSEEKEARSQSEEKKQPSSKNNSSKKTESAKKSASRSETTSKAGNKQGGSNKKSANHKAQGKSKKTSGKKSASKSKR